MYYYAEINSDYLVVNTYSLSESSTNENYIAITEEQYASGDLVGKYYNSLTGNFEKIDRIMNYTGNSDCIVYITPNGETEMVLTTLIDNMQVEMDSKADVDHIHTGYASSDDLALLEDVVDAKANASHTHSEYADINHSHNGYATQTALDALSEDVDGKADAAHSHTEYASTSHEHNEYAEANHNHDTSYAPISHTHIDYVTTTDFNALESEVDGKANEIHTHNNYSETTHNHDSDYASISHTHTASEVGAATSTHNHDSDYSNIGHDHDDAYAAIGHDHDEDYSAIGHTHNDYATTTALNELSSVVSGKANASHSHNDTYYTETEIDSKLAEKSDTSHTHTGVYDGNGAAASALTSAKAYTDSKIDAIVIPDALSDLTADSTHRTVTDAEKAAWNAKSNFSGSYNDLTDKPSIPSISGLATETYVDEAVSTKADNGHNHDDVYYTETEIDTLLSGKASASHNHNSSYDAKGTAETKANAVQANLDVVSEDLAEHIDNADIHFTAAERTKLSGIAANANNYSHPNSGVTAGTYKSVTVNAQGHVTGGTNPTTLAGYGITDAETKGAAASALSSAKAYADELMADEVTNRDTAIATAKSSAISTAASDATTKINNHNTSTSAHNDIRVLISDITTKLNNFLDVDDATIDQLSEVIALINNNKGTLESLTTSKVSVSDIIDNLTTSNASKVLSAKQGVAIKSLIDALQTNINDVQTEIGDGFEEITSERIRTLFSN